MAARSVRLRLDDIREAIDGIVATIGGTDFETFRTVWHLRRATERGLEIISEASRSIPEDLKALAPEIPWPEIAAIGNILRHEYQRVEPLIVWNIVERHLAPLSTAVDRLAERLDAAENS